MAFCNNTNIVGSIPTIELTGCKHGAPAVFASGGENALCDPLGSRVRYRERGRGDVKIASKTILAENHKKRVRTPGLNDTLTVGGPTP